MTRHARLSAILLKHDQLVRSPFTEDRIDLEKLLDLCFTDQKNQIPMYATWVLEGMVISAPSVLEQIYHRIIQQLPRISNQGSQRIFAKLLTRITDPKQPLVLTDTQQEILIETLFAWIIDPKKPVAILVHSVQVLYQLSDHHPWIKDELVAQLAHLMKSGSPAIQSRGKKIQSKLKKNTEPR